MERVPRPDVVERLLKGNAGTEEESLDGQERTSAMKPTDKKWPQSNVAGQQPQRPATLEQPTAHARESKPAVAQAKSAAPTSARPHPAAPPVYKPQAKPGAVQQKTAHPSQTKKQPVSPPVYRPQPVSKALQTKGVVSGPPPGRRQPEHKPAAAPPVYRPQALPKVLQAKKAEGQRPQGGQPGGKPFAPLRTPHATHRHTGAGVSGVIQRTITVEGKSADAAHWYNELHSGNYLIEEEHKPALEDLSRENKVFANLGALRTGVLMRSIVRAFEEEIEALDKQEAEARAAKKVPAAPPVAPPVADPPKPDEKRAPVIAPPQDPATGGDIERLARANLLTVGAPVNMNTDSYDPDEPKNPATGKYNIYNQNYSYPLIYSGKVIAYLHAHYNATKPDEIPAAKARFNVKGVEAELKKQWGGYLLQYSAPATLQAAAKKAVHK